MEILWVALSKIKIDPELQRERDDKRVAQIAKEFKISRLSIPRGMPNRDGSYKKVRRGDRMYLEGTGTVHVWDGQHGTYGAEAAGVTELPIAISMDMTREEAAEHFALQNRLKRNVRVEELADKMLKSGDPSWLRVKDVTDDLGFEWATLPLNTIQQLALGKDGSLTHLRRVGDFVNKTWEGQPARVNTHVLKAVSGLLHKYTGNQALDIKRLQTKAGAHPVSDLIEEAIDYKNRSRKYENIDTAKALRKRLVSLHDSRKGTKLDPTDD